MFLNLPEEKIFQLDATLEDYERLATTEDRRLYLTSAIESSDVESDGIYMSKCTQIVNDIISFNRLDAKSKTKKRKPIRLYINSPGGHIHEGFPVISAIELSKTPVYTINIGEWCSMAFLIGITGHKRFSLPYMTFLMHDGSNFIFDSSSKVQDRVEFDRRFSEKIIKEHVLKHSKMTTGQYDALSRVEYYMLPEDALTHGFIDEIVEDINTIL